MSSISTSLPQIVNTNTQQPSSSLVTRDDDLLPSSLVRLEALPPEYNPVYAALTALASTTTLTYGGVGPIAAIPPTLPFEGEIKLPDPDEGHLGRPIIGEEGF